MQNKDFAKKVLIELDRTALDFITELQEDAFFSTGTKLSKSQIISAIIDILNQLKVSGYGIHDSVELKENILNQIKLNYVKKDNN